MTDRLPPLPPEQWTDDQRRYAQEIIDGPRGALISPFIPLIRSPELMAHAQRMGEYLRYRSALPLRLSELAILMVARAWMQPVEWDIHAPIALKAGVARATVDALARGEPPAGLDADEQAVYDYCTELQTRRTVGDTTWATATARFGEQGAVDLTGIVGYYTLLAMMMNTARTPSPGAGEGLPRLTPPA